MEEVELQQKLDEMDYRASCKRFCDDIDQRLEKVTAGTAERAIWELFQNAGDVARESADGKKAYIRMTLTPTEFSFAHKGKPFTYDTLNSLVKQVSSQSKENDEEATGQYGTGFVTTHSFGKVLSITSSMEKPFLEGKYIDVDDFIIDRSYTNKQDFYEKMPAQLANVKGLAIHAPVTSVAREWTVLRYNLSTAVGNNGLEKALRGINAAVKALPYLMTINPRIAEVEIDNQIDGCQIKFCAHQLEDECGLKVMQITKECNGKTTTQKIYYIASENREDVIILPLDSPTTPRPLEGMAKLFVNYPLIGTENFGFEFIFHSRRFIPEEERNGLYLPKQEANSPQKYENNVTVLNEMTDMLFSTLKDLQHDFNGWEQILNLNLDAPEGADYETSLFYREFKNKWVSFYEDLNVFDVDGERRSLYDGDVFLYSNQIVDSLSNDEIKDLDAVYNAVKEFWGVPSKELIVKWSKVVSTWYEDSEDCFLSVDKIAEKLSEENVSTDIVLGFNQYLNAIGSTSLFDEYTLIPNRDGELMYKSELRDAQSIPGWICDLVSQLIPDDLAMFVDEKFISVDTFSRYTRNDLRKALNDVLENKARETFRNNANPHRCDDSMLRSLAKLSLISRTDSEDTYRAAAMKVIAPYLGIPYELKVLPALDSEEKDLAPLPFKHLVENLLFDISTKDSDWVTENSDFIYALHSSLYKWAEFYNRNDKKGMATDYACFPNMLNQPSLAKELRNGSDIPEEMFEFYNKVNGKDLRSTLVSPEYGDFYEFTKVDANVIAKEIEDKLAEDNFSHDVVLDIIKYVDKSPECARLFPRISDKKADLFMKQVKPECKEGVFRLMKIDDADKLNQLADLADDCDLDEIIRLGKLALLSHKNEKADFEYKKALGEFVENSILEQLKIKLISYCYDSDFTIDVQYMQGGQDLVVYCNGTPVYFIEVKSRWGTDHSVEMSPLQLKTCVQEADRYALIYVNMTGVSHPSVDEHIYPEVEDTMSRLKAITNIGSLARTAEMAVHSSEEKVYIGGNYSCVVPQKTIQTEGQSFEQMIERIVEECSKVMALD